MDAKTNETADLIRHTLEYQEARAILARKAELRAEMARINAELKQVRRLLPKAVELAKTDTDTQTE